MESTSSTYGTINNCGFVYPNFRRYPKIGFKCPQVIIPYKAFDDPPIVEVCGNLYVTKSMKVDETGFFLVKEKTLANAIAIIPGTIVAYPGENEIKNLANEGCFYLMSSVSINNCSQGMYLNVKGTPFEGLQSNLSDDECAVNCEVASCVDEDSGCELLFLRILRNIRIGEQLVLGTKRRHEFQLNQRGHGRRLTYFNDITFKQNP